MSEMEA